MLKRETAALCRADPERWHGRTLGVEVRWSGHEMHMTFEVVFREFCICKHVFREKSKKPVAVQ
jgi:hypothetical protein